MIFTQFDASDIVTGRTQPVSTGIWSDGNTAWGSGSAALFYTSSAQTAISSSTFEPLNGMYYTNVYDGPTGSIDSEIYYSLTYGNRFGSGSSDFDTGSAAGSLIFPTKAIYNQYRNLLLTPGDPQFTFATSSANAIAYIGSDEIYVLSFTGAKMKDQLDPGQFEMTIGGGVGGSIVGGTISIIDDSRYNSNPTSLQTGGKMYNLIRGTIASGSYGINEYQGIGVMYPSLGMIVLNAPVLHSLIGKVEGKSLKYVAPEWTGSFSRLQNTLFTGIRSGSAVAPMKARVTEFVPARHFFVRVKNQEYNYSNNPTFVISANDNPANQQDVGKIRFTDFYTDPKVYITTVGLYNDTNDLVAVAKLSQPLLKDFTNECLVKIKIDV